MMQDPIRELFNYLTEIHSPTNLYLFLRFSIVQSGQNNHTGTYTLDGVVIGTGTGNAVAPVMRIAATRALQYLRANGIPNGRLSDPVRDLNNYLMETHSAGNLVALLQFSSIQTGPNHQATHTGTYSFRGVVIGTGTGTTTNFAKRVAATRAVQYFHTKGIPGGFDPDPVRELNDYLKVFQGPENLAPFLQFSSVQSGPNHQAMQTGTYTFCGVFVGRGTGTNISLAKAVAAMQALQYFRTQGIPLAPQPSTFPISVG